MSTAVHVEVETIPTAKGHVALGHILCPKVAEREAVIVHEELTAAAAKHGWRLVIDFGQVTFLTSVGLGTMVTLFKTVRENKGRMIVYGVRPELMELLKITKLDRVFTIVKDRDVAMKGVV